MQRVHAVRLRVPSDAMRTSAIRHSGSTKELRSRGAAMYERARGYCVRALEVRHPDAGRALQKDARPRSLTMTAADVPALYWTGVAWGGPVTNRQPVCADWRARDGPRPADACPAARRRLGRGHDSRGDDRARIAAGAARRLSRAREGALQSRGRAVER